MLENLKKLYKKEPAILTGIITGLVVAVAGRFGVAIDIDNFNEFLSVVLAGGGAGALIRGQVTPNEDVAVRKDEGGVEPNGYPHPNLGKLDPPPPEAYDQATIVREDE